MLELRLEAYGERRTLYIDKHTATFDGRRYSLWDDVADLKSQLVDRTGRDWSLATEVSRLET